MLKTLYPPESELLRLCREKSWAAVVRRSQSYPIEAAPNESALRGLGTTVMAMAVRSGAPKETIQALLEAHEAQLGVVHQKRGTVLHEALKHRASYDVLQLLIQSIVQSDRHHQLLGCRDDLGRTSLHYMVERAIQDIMRGQGFDETFSLLAELVRAYPSATQSMDSDGNTPLILLLLVPGFGEYSDQELQIIRVVRLFVSNCPAAATVCRKLPRSSRVSRGHSAPIIRTLNQDACSTPLYYAILNRRSIEVVRVLLRADADGGRKIVSHYQETPLHVAVTMRAPMSVLEALLANEPAAAATPDMQGLTPVDWIWIRHVLDWFSPEPSSAVNPSRRRFLGSEFLKWQDSVSRQMSTAGAAVHEGDPFSEREKNLLGELMKRVEAVIPVAARNNNTGHILPCSLLHAVCRVSCPVPLLRFVLNKTSAEVLRSPEYENGRFPLHSASSQLLYISSVELGMQRKLHRVVQSLPFGEILSKYPLGATICDGRGQLPLHIAIESAKKCRAAFPQLQDLYSAAEKETIALLLSSYPDSLEQKDGRTKLYPFLQAAAAEGSSLDTIYFLFRRHPTLVTAGIVAGGSSRGGAPMPAPSDVKKES